MKRIIFILVILCLYINIGNAQLYMQSTNQQFVIDATESALFIIQQEYFLKDSVTGDIFGRNEQNWFGAVTSLGIKVNGGYILTDKALRPWEYDKDYDNFRGSYIPTNSKSLYKGLKDTLPVKLSLTELKYEELSPVLYQVSDSLFHGEGLMPDKCVDEKNGWILWVVADKSTDSLTVSYITYKKQIVMEFGKNEYDIEKPNTTNQEVLGGMFVIAKQTAIGQITFALAGVMIEQGDKWVISFPFAPTISTNENEVLTPIGVK